MVVIRACRSESSPEKLREEQSRRIERFLDQLDSHWASLHGKQWYNQIKWKQETASLDEFLDFLPDQLRDITSFLRKELTHAQLPEDFTTTCLNFISAVNRMGDKAKNHPHIPTGSFEMILTGIFTGGKELQTWGSEIQRLASETDEAGVEILNCATKYGARIPEDPEGFCQQTFN